MSDLDRARRAGLLFAIGLGLGLLSNIGNTTAAELGTPSYDLSTFKVAYAVPFEQPQNTPHGRFAQPFGLETSALVKGGLQNKWSAVKKKLHRESRILERCRADEGTCPSGANKFLAIVDKALTREGWARIGEINRSINLNIRAVDDMTQHGVLDRCATPLATFTSNAGDCEDYAIAKYVALREIGIEESDLRLVVVHDRKANEHHAVAAVHYNGRWLILDNRTLNIRQDVDIAEFDPMFVIDQEGVKRLTTFASKPQNSTPSVSPPAEHLHISFGWQSAPLLL